MDILVVEDEPELASALARGLEEEQFRVEVCAHGTAALRKFEQAEFDLVLLDVMLPDISGFDVVDKMRRNRHETPVIMLTARDALSDIVRGLDTGADDYLTKPFSFLELLSRIRAIERRVGQKPRNVLVAGDLVLDIFAQRAFLHGESLALTLTEFRLLEVLTRHQGRVISRKTIIGEVWGDRREVQDNTLDAFVRLLRNKLEQYSASKLIQTHRGAGYSIGIAILQ